MIWNRAAETLVGRGPANLPIEEWSPHYEMYGTDGVTPLSTAQLPLVRAIQGETVRMESVVRSPQAPKGAWLEFTGRPLKDEMGASRGGLVVFRDVTARKAAEHEIHALNDELEQRVHDRTAQLEAANKELEAFTYSVSHDLRAPLRHISGFSRILAEEFGPALPAEAQHHLQRIEDGTRRMGQLVDDLLNLARVGRRDLSLQITGFKSVVEEVIDSLASEVAGRQVEWKIGALPYVECDPGLINQVFQNLIANALKFTRPRTPAVIEIGQKKHNGTSVVYVRDNGVGFSMKYAEKLFGVFQRLHRIEEFEGTGVGLATVQRIIQKHGGRIWAEAELDKGATFYFTLANLETNEIKAEAAAGGTP
jgi:light-regulated signal transduction histidine kinase (bacteriophytochrome)